MGLNYRDNNMCEEMKLLTRWGQDMMTIICISFPNTFSKKNKKSLGFVQSIQFVQLIMNQNWFRQWLGKEKTLSHYLSQWWSRPMVHIRVSWTDWFLRRIQKLYPCGEKRYCLSTRGIPSPPQLKVGNSDHSGRVGSRDGLTVFCKIPIS